jgi:methionyl-tRNA formyltransferase
MKIALFTGLFGAWSTPILKAFLDSDEVSIAHVYAQPFRKKSSDVAFLERHKIRISTPELCEKKSVPFLAISSANSAEFIDSFRALAPDLAISFGYGEIFNDQILSVPRRAFLNIHPSLLPEHRGPNPFQSILWKGGDVGFSIHRVAKKIDGGPVLYRHKVSTNLPGSASEMMHLVGAACASKMPEIMRRLKALDHWEQPTPTGSYFKKFDLEAFRLCSADTKEDIRRKHLAARYGHWLHFYVGETKVEIKDFAFLASRATDAEPGTILDFAEPSFSIQMQGYILVVLDWSLPAFDSKTLEQMFMAEAIVPNLKPV